MRMRKQVMVLILTAILAGIAVYQNRSGNMSDRNAGTPAGGVAASQQVEELPKVGFKAPPFTLKALDGGTYSIPHSTGKPVIVNFWASWCGPCRLEAPELVKLYDKYKGKLEIYAVNMTTQDTAEDAKAFADAFGFKFPVLLDDDEKNPVSNRYRVQAIPTTFFVDKNGRIADKVTGLADPQTLESKFKRLADTH
jgi:thiol-disulfide isomerase/thioredoxin